MSDNLYSKQEYAQFRGPTTSDKYNERVENLYKDLATLINRVGLAEEDGRLFLQRLLKEHFAVVKTLEDVQARVDALEAGDTVMSFGSPEKIDNDRFDTTDYAIPNDGRCFWDSQHSIFTLPKIETSSFSKLKMVNTDGTSVIPSSFEALASGNNATADSLNATLDTSDVYNAVLQEVGTVWERNVLVTSPDPNGAEVVLYVRFPSDLVVNENTNCLIIHPFPVTGCDLVDVKYTTGFDVALNSTDSYYPLNVQEMYSGEPRAIGWVPPGGWTGDEAVNCGPKIYYFDPVRMTGLRLVLRQRNYYVEDNKYIYSYGLSKLDARYEKFSDTGKTIVRFDAPDGGTISDVSNVTPDIWNILEAEVPDVFDYRVLWETSYNSGVYTETPVALSSRVWIEVTLAKNANGATPMLSGLNVEYS